MLDLVVCVVEDCSSSSESDDVSGAINGYHNVLETSFLGRPFVDGLIKLLLLFALLEEYVLVSDLTLFGGRGAEACFEDNSMPVKENTLDIFLA